MGKRPPGWKKNRGPPTAATTTTNKNHTSNNNSDTNHDINNIDSRKSDVFLASATYS